MSQNVVGEIVNEGDAAVVTFATSSISNIEDVADTTAQIGSYVAEHRPRRVIFDFAGVKFFSSQVLGLLLAVRSSITPLGAEVVVSSIQPHLHRVFKITNLDQVFRFFPDRDSALNMSQ